MLGAIYQLGVAWHGGALRGRRPILLAVGAMSVLATVIGLGLYPVSMIGVPGQSIENTSPPTVALLAFGAVQAGLLLASAPAVTAWLRRAPWRYLLVTANSNAMALYLWHMVPVVVVALACYPTGLLPQPDLGSEPWWLWRLAWVLTVVTTAELVLLWLGRSLFARPSPTVQVRLPACWSVPLLVAGAAVAAVTLWRFAAHGFAPGGDLPVAGALGYIVGVVLASLSPIGTSRTSAAPTRMQNLPKDVRSHG